MTACLNGFSRFFLVLLLFFSGVVSSSAQAEHERENEEKLNVSELIIHHVLDDHVWHFADGFVLHLPIIVYSAEKGLDVFSSANFYDEHHNIVPYKGYKLEHNHLSLADSGKPVLDISITKNVAMLFINAALLLIIFVSVANAYKRNRGKAPRGLQSFFEPIILFVRDEIAKPNIGHRYERYFPFLLTLFFFILFGNLLGLIPGSGNLTGNIAVTMVLAVMTFLVTNVSGNRNYWSHIFWTPGLPFVLRPIILLVEVIGVFTKPISLMIRLFVAITAGHIVLLSLIALTFVFARIWVGLASSLMVLFITLIEILVAAIQAYVFTLFSALYIGMATAEHEHH
ncbi:MAG: F0F1 ATP synthase subunit A [Cyclobacteriaceae bacterium]